MKKIKKLFVLAPGYETEFVNLNAAATAARESQNADIKVRNEKRKKHGTPESEDTDYVEASRCLKDAIKAAKNGSDSGIYDAIAEMNEYMGAVSIGPVKPFKGVEGSEDLTVKLRIVSRTQFQALSEAALYGFQKNNWEAAKKLILACVVDVEGLECEGPKIDPVDLWDAAEILPALYAVANYFQKMSHLEKKRFGSPQL